MLADESHWSLTPQSGLRYDPARRTLCLASERTLPVPSDPEADLAEALSRVEVTPQALDQFGAHAFWDPAGSTIFSAGLLPEPIAIFRAAPGAVITDLALGYDGVLYIAMDGGVL